MSPDRLLERIRAADPAPGDAVTDDELFARIVAQPGDSRLVAAATLTRHRRRRWLGLLAASAVLVGAGGAAGAIGLGAFTHASPKALLEANPAGQFSRRPGKSGGDGQTVIPQSVHRATTFTVPGVGRFAWWIGLSRPSGWLCGAIRQPNGTWADLDAADANKYQVGGPMPGCGNLPWHDSRGFAYDQTSVPSPNGVWRIAYGYVPTLGHPVAVRDRVSGATARLGDGRYFAIVMPLCKGHRCYTPAPPGYQLQTLDAAGGVLITDQFDPGM